MAFDYSEIVEVARELVAEFGREVTFIRYDQGSADPNKPWEGSTGGSETQVVMSAVVVPPNQVRIFGLSALGAATEFDELISYSENILIVFPENYDMREFTHVQDDARYGITGVQVLKPANTQLLAYVGVRR